jgi:hypothetical protein
MSRFLSLVALLACACGSSSPSGTEPDAGVDPGDDGGGGGGETDAGVDPGPSAGSTTIELTLTNRPNNASRFSFVVGYQDGSAPWTVAPAPSGDKYTFQVSAPSFGVMFACTGTAAGTTGQLRTVNLAYFAVGERTKLTLDVPQRCSDRMTGTGMVTLSGSVTNRPFGGSIVVQVGTRSTVAGPQTGYFAMQVPTGTRDVLVYHTVPQGNGDFYVDEAVTVRDLNLTGPSTKTIDFSTSETTSSYDVNVPTTTARIVAGTMLYTANGTQASFTRLAGNWESNALAAVQRRSTDVYDQSIAVLTAGAGATITNATSAPGVQTYVAPAPLGTVTATVASTQPYPLVQASWPAYTGAVGYTWTASQPDVCAGFQTCPLAWTAQLSPGVTGMSPSYRAPDLSTVTGWKADYNFASAAIQGSVTAIRSTAGATDFPTGIPAAGTQRVFVRDDFDVTP